MRVSSAAGIEDQDAAALYGGDEEPVELALLTPLLYRAEDVANGPALARLLERAAEDVRSRTRACGAREDCTAPFRLVFPDHPRIASAIAACHRAGGMPIGCRLLALRMRDGSAYLMAFATSDRQPLIADGWGDTDLTCVSRRAGPVAQLMRRNFPATSGYRFVAGAAPKLIRAGLVSEVYTKLRENLVIALAIDGARVTLTPSIFFSRQNAADQTLFQPISIEQYDFYVKTLIKRLSRDFTCADNRPGR